MLCRSCNLWQSLHGKEPPRIFKNMFRDDVILAPSFPFVVSVRGERQDPAALWLAFASATHSLKRQDTKACWIRRVWPLLCTYKLQGQGIHAKSAWVPMSKDVATAAALNSASDVVAQLSEMQREDLRNKLTCQTAS